MPTLTTQTLQQFATKLLSAGGANEAEASRVAAALVDANLRGFDSHGVMRIPFYLDALAKGDVVSGADLTVISETPTLLAVDANWGFGQVQAERLTNQLILRAQDAGTAVGTMYHSSHVGRLGEYCEMAAAEGLLSMMMVNTHGAARRVAPPGGTAPRLGTNPLAMGVPYDQRPLILDFSTSATAEGKVRVKKIAGEPCPPGWIQDSQGRPTTNPNDLYADPPGTILPMGGTQPYKGFGLALMVDIFSGALSGGLCSRETPLTPNGNCVFMMVVNPQYFGGQAYFAAEVQQLVQFVESGPKVPGVERIVLPGDPERESAESKRASGIFLDEGNWLKLAELAGRLEVAVPA